jgi:hypothetical protein
VVGAIKFKSSEVHLYVRVCMRFIMRRYKK